MFLQPELNQIYMVDMVPGTALVPVKNGTITLLIFIHQAEKLGGAGTFQLPAHPETLALGKGAFPGHGGLTKDHVLGGKRAACKFG